MFFGTVQWRVALRFLFSLKGQRFLVLLTVLGLVLVGATIACTYTALCVAEAFSTELRHKLLIARPHVEIALFGRLHPELLAHIEKDHAVERVVPLFSGTALLQGMGRREGVEVWGSDSPALLHDWACSTLDGQSVSSHALMADQNGIVLGGALLDEFYPHLSSSQGISLAYPLGDVDPFGNLIPIEQPLTVTGACRSGVYPIDRKTVFVSSEHAKRLFSQGEADASRVWIFLRKPFSVDSFLKKWQSYFSNWGEVKSWKTSNKVILGALRLERALTIAVIVLVFALSSMTLYGVLSILSIEKRADFSVLYTLGLARSAFLGILFKMALILAGIGALLGAVMGVGMVAFLFRLPLSLPEAYYVETLRVSQQFLSLIWIIAAGTAVQLGSALIPGFWIRRMEPVEALRFVEGGIV